MAKEMSKEELEEFIAEEEDSIFKRCQDIANKRFDGHITLYKFTTNWGFCFGIPNDLCMDTVNLFEGDTPEKAMQKALQNPKRVEDQDICSYSYRGCLS